MSHTWSLEELIDKLVREGKDKFGRSDVFKLSREDIRIFVEGLFHDDISRQELGMIHYIMDKDEIVDRVYDSLSDFHTVWRMARRHQLSSGSEINADTLKNRVDRLRKAGKLPVIQSVLMPVFEQLSKQHRTIPLEEAKRLVTETVEKSKIKDKDKRSILFNVSVQTTVMGLLEYLKNAILVYMNLGVTKKWGFKNDNGGDIDMGTNRHVGRRDPRSRQASITFPGCFGTLKKEGSRAGFVFNDSEIAGFFNETFTKGIEVFSSYPESIFSTSSFENSLGYDDYILCYWPKANLSDGRIARNVVSVLRQPEEVVAIGTVDNADKFREISLTLAALPETYNVSYDPNEGVLYTEAGQVILQNIFFESVEDALAYKDKMEGPEEDGDWSKLEVDGPSRGAPDRGAPGGAPGGAGPSREIPDTDFDSLMDEQHIPFSFEPGGFADDLEGPMM